MRGAVVALGEPATVRGLALAGVRVLPAVTPDEVRRTWAALPAGTAAVLLTRAAFDALGAAATAPHAPLVAVIPGVVEPGVVEPRVLADGRGAEARGAAGEWSEDPP